MERMESLGWDISLVEVVDMDVYMYVLVMTTVIYNSPYISLISFVSIQIGINT